MLLKVASSLTKQAVCGACEEIQPGFSLWIQLGKQLKDKNWKYFVNIRGMISCNKKSIGLRCPRSRGSYAVGFRLL